MERYAFRPVSTPTAPQATDPNLTSNTLIMPGSTTLRSNEATVRTHSPVTSFATPMTEKILQRIPIAMMLKESDAEDGTFETMDTEVTDNRSLMLQHLP